MSRDTTLLLALGTLTAAALVVGFSGWVLFVRERRLAATTSNDLTTGGEHSAAHHEAHEEE